MTEPEQRLAAVSIDPGSLPPAAPEVEQEREVAVADLLDANSFAPDGGAGGPYALRLAREDNRLILEVEGPGYSRAHGLSLTPFRGIIKDYFLVCDSYFEAVRSSPERIEAFDMGRRGLHNEGADALRARLEGKVELDHETARRLFTLVCALYRRG